MLAYQHSYPFQLTSGIDQTQSPRRRKSTQEDTADRESRERQIEELQLENKKLQQLKEEHEGQIRDLQQQLHKAWQQVDGKPVSPEKCYATGKGLEVAVVGEHSTAVLHAADEEGQEFDKSPENIQCELKSETNDIEVSCKVEKKYEISYKPTHRGIHQLSIRVEETQIRGSPFTVLVKLPIQRPGTPVQIIENITNPWGLAVRHNGEIIAAELRNRCVSIFAPNGEKIRTFGTQGSAHGQFKYLRGIAFDSAGNILVAEGGNHRIQKFTAEGQFLIAVGRKGSGHLEFDDPIGIVINHKNKKVYICDCDNHRIQILNEDLTFSAIFGSYGSGDGQFSYPWDVALDSTGCTYIADNENHCIQVFTPEGMFLRRFGKKGSGEGELHSPSSITIDSDDLVYITEVNNNRVSVFTCEGKFVRFFGTNKEGMVLFYKPCGIAVDKSGLVYVSDTNDRLLAF